MARDLRYLHRMLIDRANSLPEIANKKKKKIVEAIVRDLVVSTPVDTSRALSNWQVTIGSASAGRIEPLFYGSKGSTQETSAADAIAKAMKVIASAKPGESLWIQNKLPYIGKLNDGSSTQAPAGFVERAILVARLSARSK